MTAGAAEPARCLGITGEAWAYGGPVTHSANQSMSTASQIINDKVNFVVQSASLSPTPVAGGPAGVFTINAVLTKGGVAEVWAPVKAVVKTLTNGNTLLSATEGNGSAGSKQAVDAGSDDASRPGTSPSPSNSRLDWRPSKGSVFSWILKVMFCLSRRVIIALWSTTNKIRTDVIVA